MLWVRVLGKKNVALGYAGLPGTVHWAAPLSPVSLTLLFGTPPWGTAPHRLHLLYHSGHREEAVTPGSLPETGKSGGYRARALCGTLPVTERNRRDTRLRLRHLSRASC